MKLSPETAHNLTIWALKNNMVPSQDIYNSKFLKTNVFGLNFKNPVGLAAGFDKNADCIYGLKDQNFGFVEVGTSTPVPQDGNPKPRIFRITDHEAVVNRLGFNNKGIEIFSQKLRQWKYDSTTQKSMIVGANVGKNKNSPNDSSDYLTAIKQIYNLCDYITVNISSPNTPGLRELQSKEHFDALIFDVVNEKKLLSKKYKIKVPILVKISPDENNETLQNIAEIVLKHKIDGVIVSNTSVTADMFNDEGFAEKKPEGGLSGKPIFDISTETLKKFYIYTKGKIPLIGVGGISNAEDAYKKIRNGASLVQAYTGFIYNGFGMVNEINKGLVKLLKKDKYKNISEAIGVDAK